MVSLDINSFLYLLRISFLTDVTDIDYNVKSSPVNAGKI